MLQGGRSGLISSMELTVQSQKKLDEVQSILDRWDERLQGHHHEKRQQRRRTFRGEFLLRVPEESVQRVRKRAKGPSTVLVRARNISSNGIAFLHTDKIDAEEVMICLEVGVADPRWYRGKVVRCREVQNEFWEYGVQLTGRCDNEIK
jgi:hypothetical protein